MVASFAFPRKLVAPQGPCVYGCYMGVNRLHFLMPEQNTSGNVILYKFTMAVRRTVMLNHGRTTASCKRHELLLKVEMIRGENRGKAGTPLYKHDLPEALWISLSLSL